MICMNILQIPFFLFLFSSVVHSKNHCPTSYCPNNSLPIQYPFKLQGQQTQNCSYTTLRCSSQGIPILNLPYSGDFYVRDIWYYEFTLIQLYDPGNCLPKRLMSLNFLSLNPVVAMKTLNYTFYSCPSELIALSNLIAIDCLSNSSSAIVATHTVSSEVMKKLYRCNEIVTSSIPVPLDPPDFIGNQTDFVLEWFAPYCKSCPHEASGLLPTAFIMMSFLTIIMPLVICIGCCAHFIRMFRKEVRVNSSNVT